MYRPVRGRRWLRQGVADLERAGEPDRTVKILGFMEFDVHPNVIREATGEEARLLYDLQVPRVRHARLECLGVGVDRGRERKSRERRQVIRCHRRAKTLVAQLPEGRPIRSASSPFQDQVPLLGDSGEVVRCIPDLIGLVRHLGMEELLTAVQPPQRILLAIVCGESEFVEFGWHVRGGGYMLEWWW